jgi:uncharacterized protein
MQNYFSWLKTAVILMFLLFIPRGGKSQTVAFNLQAELGFRADRERWMKSPNSPLALAGLYWLKEGANSFGTDAQNLITLTAGATREPLGDIILQNKKVTLRVSSSKVKVTIKGEPVIDQLLRADESGGPFDLVEMGDWRMKIIRRGDRLGVRLINLKNPALSSFVHLSFFDPTPKFLVEAEFIPYSPPRRIKIISVIGVEEEMSCPGQVRFQLNGQLCALEPVAEPGEPLFFIFKDRTNGGETYGGGRFLNADPPQKGKVLLNFNRATNPYCAYSPYATCPMPPMQNWLKVRVPAGEKKYVPGHPGRS